MVYSKTDFKKHIETIHIDGFKLKNSVQAYLFIRKQSDKTETITLSYRNYAPHGFYIDGVSVDIYFNKAEDILEQYGLVEEYKSTFGKALQDLKEVDYEKLTTEINSDETFNVVKNEVKNIIEKGVMPFLARFTTLEEIASFLADKKLEEIVPYIQGAILLPKTVLIMKIANHPDFKKRLIEFRNVLLEYASTNNKYQILLNKYDALFSKDLEAS
jgi:hypothetical protein